MTPALPVIVEVTNTLALPYTTGYQRVVRSLVGGLQGPAGDGLEVVPVVWPTELGGYRRLLPDEARRLATHPPGGRAVRRADSFGPLSPIVRGVADLPVARRARAGVDLRRRRRALTPEVRALAMDIPPLGSVFMDLEPGWHDPEPRDVLLPRLRASGVHTAVLVADVMPELFPDWFDPTQRRLFGRWLRAHLATTDLFVCISECTERDLQRVARESGVTRGLRTAVIPLGADFPVVEPAPVALPPSLGRFLLVVGTIEPRKNQRLAVEAFDRLARRHPDLGLVLVGKEGWLVDDLVADLRSHPEWGRRLLWLEGVDDAGLAWLYQHAFLTLAPSRYEGLGVPVMEALHHGCPTIASTGGALVEAGDGRVETLDPDDPDGLEVLVERHLLDPAFHEAAAARTAGYRAPSWDDAARRLAELLLGFGDVPPPLVGGR
ncbi:MAG: glycosyltransferase family 4 protein [Microthrixaceae bacterium]